MTPDDEKLVHDALEKFHCQNLMEHELHCQADAALEAFTRLCKAREAEGMKTPEKWWEEVGREYSPKWGVSLANYNYEDVVAFISAIQKDALQSKHPTPAEAPQGQAINDGSGDKITDEEIEQWLEATNDSFSDEWDNAVFSAVIDRFNQYIIFSKSYASMAAENIRLQKQLAASTHNPTEEVMSDTNDLVAKLVNALEAIACTAQQASQHEPEQFCEVAYDIASNAIAAASNYKPEVMVVNEGLREALKDILKDFKSCDKDNMEFSSKTTCWIIDKAYAALIAASNYKPEVEKK